MKFADISKRLGLPHSDRIAYEPLPVSLPAYFFPPSPRGSKLAVKLVLAYGVPIYKAAHMACVKPHFVVRDLVPLMKFAAPIPAEPLPLPSLPPDDTPLASAARLTLLGNDNAAEVMGVDPQRVAALLYASRVASPSYMAAQATMVEGISVIEAAKRYGVTRSAVYQQRYAWKAKKTPRLS